jgi:hypothetical protein
VIQVPVETISTGRLAPKAAAKRVNAVIAGMEREAVAKQLWYGPVYFRRSAQPCMTPAVAHEGRKPGVMVAGVIVVKQHGRTLGVEIAPGQFTDSPLSLPRSRPSEQAA